METQTVSLSAHPQILDLMEALEQNGLTKQKEDVQSLVGYIENNFARQRSFLLRLTDQMGVEITAYGFSPHPILVLQII